MLSPSASTSDLTHPDTSELSPRSPASWVNLRGLFLWFVALVAILPAGYVFTQVAQASGNIVYWDEFDTALAMVLRLQDGVTPSSFFAELFAMNNEHRMVTSRLLFAAMFALTGTVNFSVISIVGNATLVALVLLLVANAGSTLRRLQLGAFLGLLLFQLEHYENFLWSGASIDHFQVVFLAAVSTVAVAQASRRGTITGGIFAALATFTLAHGLLTWVSGGAMLAHQRRWKELAGWCILGGVTAGAFLHGFSTNHAHEFSGLTVEGLLNIAAYWLTLLGAVPALGDTGSAPAFGVLLLAGLGWLVAQGGMRREPIAVSLTLFAILALGLIAVGRAAESNGVVFSRYMVLGATAWALTGFMALERYSCSHRPLWSLGGTVLVLAGFNVTANCVFLSQAESWIECRDRAALRFQQFGVDGKGTFSLHPEPTHSTALLKTAAARGVYRMNAICERESFPKAQPSTRIVYYVEEMTVNDHTAYVGGWAAMPAETSERGMIHLVLKSDQETFIYSTVAMSRPDVALAMKNKHAMRSGFMFAIDRDALPSADFQIGILIAKGNHAEFRMTAHHLDLVGAGKALLANGD